jgi:hypothetical protein
MRVSTLCQPKSTRRGHAQKRAKRQVLSQPVLFVLSRQRTLRFSNEARLMALPRNKLLQSDYTMSVVGKQKRAASEHASCEWIHCSAFMREIHIKGQHDVR